MMNAKRQKAVSWRVCAKKASDNTTGSFVLYMDGLRIGDEMASAGQGFDTYSVVSGGKATLQKGEHELKLEITNDWIDIDYVEFKAVGGSGGSDRIAGVRFGMTEAESSFSLFDMQGQRVASFRAAGMDDAVRMVKDGFKGIRQGVYLVRGVGKAGMKKVTVFEK